MNDYEHGAGTSQAQAEQVQDQQKAKQAMRSMAFEKGYENARRAAGLGGAPDAPAQVDPVAARRANLIAGGLQPDEADKAVAQEQAAKTATANAPASPGVPGPVKPVIPPGGGPPAPMAAPAPKTPSTITDNGTTGSLSDWLASAKARQNGGSGIGPQGMPAGGGPPAPGTDAADLTGATEHVNDIRAANAPAATPAPSYPAAVPAVPLPQTGQDVLNNIDAARRANSAASNQNIINKANATDVAALGRSMRPDTMSAPAVKAPAPVAPSVPSPAQVSQATAKSDGNQAATNANATGATGLTPTDDDSLPAPASAPPNPTIRINGVPVTPANASASDDETPRAKGGPVERAKQKMKPRANGGNVTMGGENSTGDSLFVGVPRPSTPTPNYPVAALRKGGRAKARADGGEIERMEKGEPRTVPASQIPMKGASAFVPMASTPAKDIAPNPNRALSDASSDPAAKTYFDSRGKDGMNIYPASAVHVPDELAGNDEGEAPVKSATSPITTSMLATRAKGGPIQRAKMKMKPAHRDGGGAVQGPWNQQTWDDAHQTVGMKNGGKIRALAAGGSAPKGPVYKVGEPSRTGKPRPELFMPHDDTSPPEVVGAHGQQVGQFKKSGVIIPHHALKAMKQAFSKMPPSGGKNIQQEALQGGGAPPDNSDGQNAPTDPHELPEPQGEQQPMKRGGAVERAKMKMKPKAA